MPRLVLLLLACALVLGACGSSDDESVDALLKQTFASDKTVQSGELNVGLDANIRGLQSLQGPVRLTLRGPFESAGKDELPRFDFTLGITSGGQTFTAGGISTGDKGYLKFAGQAFVVSDADFQQFKQGYLDAQKRSSSDKEGAPSLGALGINPRAWLTNPQKVGDGEQVGGTDTVHISAGIDVPRLLDDINRVLARASSATKGTNQTQTQVPSSLTEAQQKQIEDAVESAKVDVYTGKDDKALRKLDINVKLRKSGQIDGGTLRFSLEIADLNKDQDIKAPAGAKPLSELTGRATTRSASPTRGRTSRSSRSARTC
jgi:hypothetical protein